MVSNRCFLEILLAIVLPPLGVSLRFRCCNEVVVQGQDKLCLQMLLTSLCVIDANFKVLGYGTITYI
ncbi:hypothetical protein GUJ93_ZPchr0001g29708 [Zizania palustris]|uniref:Hydrophobic seed protein domain-containing protein n=1 Tax=Zizania palustris TaxID=103762 RepID=A0A8J5REK4_ZIZPA|nr:hypothetical protein GUJ93_ZPchr0001g29708 [Zizania palustris]